MPVREIIVTQTYVEINDGDRILHFDFADFPPSASTNETRIAHITNHVQTNFLDKRIKLKDLPADDPDKTTDPGLPWLFWEGQGGNAELVARNVIIENVIYDDTQDYPLSFNLTRIYPPANG